MHEGTSPEESEMTTETAIGFELRRVGFDTRSRVYAVAARLLRDAHGSEAKAGRDLWDTLHADAELRKEAMGLLVGVVAADMKGLPGEGQLHGAEKGQMSNAFVRQLNGDGAGQKACADQGHQLSACPSPTERSGEGLKRSADMAENRLPSTVAHHRETGGQNGRAEKASHGVPPAREPRKPGAGALTPAARKAAQAVEVKGWLDNFQIPDGPELMSLPWGSARPMAERMVREAGARAHAGIILTAIVKEVEDSGKPASSHQTIGEIVGEPMRRNLERRLHPDVIRPMAAQWCGSMGQVAIAAALGVTNAN
jgi:hypothetical protein